MVDTTHGGQFTYQSPNQNIKLNTQCGAPRSITKELFFHSGPYLQSVGKHLSAPERISHHTVVAQVAVETKASNV